MSSVASCSLALGSTAVLLMVSASVTMMYLPRSVRPPVTISSGTLRGIHAVPPQAPRGPISVPEKGHSDFVQTIVPLAAIGAAAYSLRTVLFKAIGAAAAALAIAGSASAASLTYDELQSMSYLEVKGTGLANTCPVILSGTGEKLSLPAGNYQVDNMCVEPAAFKVKLPEDSGKPKEFENSKLLTRQTYTLDGITADLKVSGDGSWNLKETDGLDYAATTVKLAQGESVPFLFTVRNFDLTGNANQLLGQFDVPSYRGSTFMDPRSRGGVTGYDYQQGLQARGDQEEFRAENLKRFDPTVGTIALKVAEADSSTGEIAGVFESIQPSDNDMGAKEAKLVKATGVWYGRVSGK